MDTEQLFVSIHEYMEKYFPIPKMNADNKEVVFQAIAAQEAVYLFLAEMLDNRDIYPGVILLEHMMRFEKAAYNDNTEDAYLYHAAFEALNTIDAEFFCLGEYGACIY